MSATAPPHLAHSVPSAPARSPIVRDSGPVGLPGPIFALHSAEFARDPHGHYAEMRRHHRDFARVQLAEGVFATLVIGWEAAVRILHNPVQFSADPIRWQATVDPHSPVMPMMGARDNALRTDDPVHRLYRQATLASLTVVDLHALHTVVEGHARDLIAEVAARGRMDLVADYAGPLAFRTINTMMGCPPEIGEQLARGFRMMFDAGTDPGEVAAVLDTALDALIALKRATPGRDIPTTLLRHPHAARMSQRQLREQVLTMCAAGIEPLQHLVANTALLIMTDDRFAGDVIGGSRTSREALDEVLFRDAPLANLCLRFPLHPVPWDGVLLPAHQPVIISMAACNTDPRVNRPADVTGYVDYSRNSSHLSFSAGPHACPARDIANQAAVDAIEELLDHLPDLRLACRPDELVWRPGGFHRALQSLPVVFGPPRSRPRH